MLLRCVPKIKGRSEKLIRKNNMMGISDLTEGQRLVGLTFNDKVTKYKQACANAIDILLKLEDKTKKELDIFLDRNRSAFDISEGIPKTINAEKFIDIFIDVILAVNNNDIALSESVDYFFYHHHIVFFKDISKHPYYLVIKDLKDCRADLSYYDEVGLTQFLGSLKGMAVFIGGGVSVHNRLFGLVI